MKKRSSYTLSKINLITNVYHKTGYNKEFSKEIVNSFFDVITSSLKQGAGVKISKFGKFFLRDKKARIGRNPGTGEQTMISARRVTCFKASPHLKKEL